jgi:hypothetical protein
MASGSQVYNGICADFPQAPMNKAKAAAGSNTYLNL